MANFFGIIFNVTMGLWSIFIWSSPHFVFESFTWFVPIGIAIGAFQLAMAVFIIVDDLEKILSKRGITF